MKKLNLLLIVALSSLTVFGQNKGGSSSGSDAFGVGTNVVTGGIGIGGTLVSLGNASPGISVSYERGIWEAGPGVISLGAYVGYKSYSYNYTDFGYAASEKWNYTIVGARGAWHWTGSGVPNLDLYGGVMLSYDALSWSYSDNSGTTVYSGPSYGNSVTLTPFAGARYYFSNHIGVYGELGTGVFVLNLGLAVKF